MKRSRTPQRKTPLTAEQILGALETADPDVRDNVRGALEKQYAQHCSAIVIRIPTEVWTAIMCMVSTTRLITTNADYFRMACVSRQWNAVASRLIAESCSVNGPQCTREVHHCRDATHVIVTGPATLGNDDIRQLQHLTRLIDMQGSKSTFDADAIAHLTELRVLHLHRKRSVWLTLFSMQLTQLTDLNLSWQMQYWTPGLDKMTNLTSLSLYRTEKYHDTTLQSLTRLTHLDLDCQRSITDAAVSCLTALCSLSLGQNDMITIDGIASLSNLRTLNLGYATLINDEDLRRLTQLETLLLRANQQITGRGLSLLTNLTRLDLDDASRNIKTADLALLTRLETLGPLPYSWESRYAVPHISGCRAPLDEDAPCVCYSDKYQPVIMPPQNG